ncbi:MAG: PAS domain S-box protein, partial [Sedimentisphaerales bacterium]|nr:PAS domain S-box protein [Sedimentisphaerales bacterium]
AIFGVAAKELVGKRPFDFMPAEEAHRAQSAIGEIFQRKDPIKDFEALYEDRKGNQRWLRTTGVPVLDERGSLKGYRGVCKDITEHKRAEETLRETTQTLEAVIQASPLPIFAVDRERIVKTWNPAAERTFGWSAQEVIGRQYPAIPKGKMDEADALFSRAMESGLIEVETLRQRKDGSLMDVSISAAPLRDSRGNINGVMAVITDITERKKAEERVKAERQRLYDVLETLPVMVCLLTSDYHVAFTNRVFRQKFGEDNGRYCYDYIFGLKGPCEFCEAYNVLKTGKPHHWECTGPDGCSIIDVYDFPFTDTNGTPLILEMDIDITERKRAEEELRVAEERFSKAFRASPNAMTISRMADGTLFEVNDMWEKTLGYSRAESVGISSVALGIWTDPAIRQKAVEQLQETGSLRDFETDLRRKTGEFRQVSLSSECLEIGGEQCLLTIIHDITERKRAEEALRSSENKYRTLLENLPQKIFLKDKNSVYISCNENYSGDLKIRAQDIAGKTDYDFYPKELADKYRADDKRIMEEDKTEEFEEEYLQEGEKRWVHTVKTPVKDPHGNLIGILGIFWDVTERRQAEHKLLEYQKQLKRLAAQLALAEERERRRIAGELHDQVAQSLALAKIKLDTVHAAVSYQPLAQALEDVSSSLEKAIQDTKSLTFDLSNPILYELGFEAAVAEWLDGQVRDKHGIATEFEDDGQPKPLDDDVRMLLFRNIRELLINCIKHAHADKVVVRVRRIDGSIEVVVEDNGIGFDPTEVKSMAVRRSEFGLLSIREGLEEMGGRFEIESKPGAGCKAIMTAPLKQKGDN